MSSNLLSLLRIEERQLLAELRATPIFQKLEAVRRVVSLYTGAAMAGTEDAQAVELLLGGSLGEGRAGGSDGVPPPAGAMMGLPSAAAMPASLRDPMPANTPTMAAATPGLAPLAEELSHLPPPTRSAAPATLAFAPAAAPAMPAALAQVAVNAEPLPGEALRDGSKAVSAVRAALLAVTR
jgi:hypothetical protein